MGGGAEDTVAFETLDVVSRITKIIAQNMAIMLAEQWCCEFERLRES